MTRRMRQLHAPAMIVVLLLTRVGVAAYLELAPEFERATGHRIVTEATSMGTGPTGIAARLGRGEAIDVVIVADTDLERLTSAGWVRPGTRVDLARSAIGMALRDVTLVSCMN